MKRFIKLFRWINVFVILATFLAYLAPYVNPQQNWFLSIFGLAYPFLLLLNILFVLIWAITKKKYFFLSLGCILMGWGHVKSLVGWNVSHFQDNVKSINILTFNVQTLHYIISPKEEKEKQERLKKFNRWFKREKVDIFCAQELQRSYDPVLDTMGFMHRYRIGGKSASIHSKYPFLRKGNLKFQKSVNAALWADIKIGEGQVIRVYSIHLQSSRIDPESIDVLAKGKIQEKKTWFNLKNVVGKFKNASSVRAEQADMVAEHIKKSPHPVIVCGDFNETPLSYAYHVISETLVDAFKEKGYGFGTTYAGKIPALRIDYILADQQIKILQHQIMRRTFSDHYPVKTTIQLPIEGER